MFIIYSKDNKDLNVEFAQTSTPENHPNVVCFFQLYSLVGYTKKLCIRKFEETILVILNFNVTK